MLLGSRGKALSLLLVSTLGRIVCWSLGMLPRCHLCSPTKQGLEARRLHFLDQRSGLKTSIIALVVARGTESLADSRLEILPVTSEGPPANHPCWHCRYLSGGSLNFHLEIHPFPYFPYFHCMLLLVAMNYKIDYPVMKYISFLSSY